MSENVDVWLKLRGARQFRTDAEMAGRAVGGMSTNVDKVTSSVKKANKHTSIFRRGLGGLMGSLKSFVGTAGAFAAGFIAYTGVKNAIDTTTEFTKATKTLAYYMGEGVAQASRWAGILQSRGINARTFVMSVRALSGQITAARKGSVGAKGAFDRLGLTWKQLQRLSPTQRIYALVQALKTHDKGASRAADMQKLLGRGAAALAPLFSKGSKGINDQMKLMDKYGVTLHGKTIRSLSQMIEAQHENQIAMMGLYLALGQHLIPWLTKALNWFNKFINQMRTGKGVGGDFRSVLHGMVTIGRGVVTFLQKAWAAGKAFWHALGYIGVNGHRALTVIKLIYTVLGGLPTILYRTRHVWVVVFNALKTAVQAVGRFITKYIINPIKWIINHIKNIPGSLRHAVTSLPGAVGHAATSAVSSGFHTATHYANPLNWQEGGMVHHGGLAVVGEAGPEIVRLPTGSNVTNNRDFAGAIAALAAQPIVVYTTMDGRVITKNVARRVADAKARR